MGQQVECRQCATHLARHANEWSGVTEGEAMDPGHGQAGPHEAGDDQHDGGQGQVRTQGEHLGEQMEQLEIEPLVQIRMLEQE